MSQCLFCYQRCPKKFLQIPEEGIIGAGKCKPVENALYTHFILRKLLDISSDWCEDFVKRQEEEKQASDDLVNPEEPAFGLCRKCSEKVHRAWKIYQNFVKWDTAWKIAQSEIKTIMSDSLNKKLRRKSHVDCFENEIRLSLFPDKMVKMCEPNFTDFETNDDIDDTSPNWKEDDQISSSEDEGKNSVGCKRARRNRRRLVRKRNTKLRSRIRKKPKKEPRTCYKCSICPAKFFEDGDLKSHIDFHSESKTLGLECPTCFFPSKSHDELEAHKFNKHEYDIPKRAFICEKCNLQCETWKKLKAHAADKHPDTPEDELGPDIQLKCAPCSKFYESPSCLITHQKQSHPELFGVAMKPVQCEQCSIVFSSGILLQYHIRAVHKRMNNYICDLCAKGFYSQKNLDAHMIGHEKSTPGSSHVCHLCGCSYAHRSGLTGHFRKFHPAYHFGKDVAKKFQNEISKSEPVDGEMFSCKLCDLKFPFKIALIVHMRSHKSVQCLLCPKQYINAQGLRQHMKLNHSPKNQETPCPHCKKVFQNPFAMHTHSMKYCKMKKINDSNKNTTATEVDSTSSPPAAASQRVERFKKVEIEMTTVQQDGGNISLITFELK